MGNLLLARWDQFMEEGKWSWGSEMWLMIPNIVIARIHSDLLKALCQKFQVDLPITYWFSSTLITTTDSIKSSHFCVSFHSGSHSNQKNNKEKMYVFPG